MKLPRRSSTLAAGVCLAALLPGPGARPGATAPASAATAPSATPTTPSVSPLREQNDAGLLAAAGPPLRRFVELGTGDDAAPPSARAALRDFRDRFGDWQIAWDRATGVPSRLWGPPIAAPGSVDSPARAAAAAQRVLAAALALLAPGAALDDFTLVSNDRDRGLRTVGFVQSLRGLPVLGGQVSFRFRNDRLFVIGSEALPDVTVEASDDAARADDVRIRDAARAWIARLAPGASVSDAADDDLAGPLLLPLIGERGVLAYRLVRRAVVATRAPVGRWAVYVDATTAEVVAREQTLLFGTGQIFYDTPVRHPGGARTTYPAVHAKLGVDGVEEVTGPAGLINWQGTLPAAVTVRATGRLVAVTNDAGAAATPVLTVADATAATWRADDDVSVDAQITTYIHAGLAKTYVRRFFAEELDYLDGKLAATVNEDGECNAYSTGDSIHFFPATDECQNTGTLPDVIYHEFGHSVHRQSVIEGAGRFEVAMSEGMSDYLAATMTGDSRMGRGFFFDDDPLRDLDPADVEQRWPEDIGEVHHTGLIFAGAMWDLRKALIADLGTDNGIATADRLYYAAVRRASSIPTTFIEILAADDDDGDLGNGTPHECAIRAAFAAHGLRDLGNALDAPGQLDLATSDATVSLRLPGLSPRCASDTLDGVELTWRRRGSTDAASAAMSLTGDVWAATMPLAEHTGVVQYQLTLHYRDAEPEILPNNPSDRWYELYRGDVVPLYCTGFETDPFADGWASSASADETDQWQWGAPSADNRASGDPARPYAGERILGTNLGSLGEDYGFYAADTIQRIAVPPIDVGTWSDVHLQYRRWLEVEDGYYDDATIFANDHTAWQQLDSDHGEDSALHHRDGEWRFHDVPLSAHITDGTVAIAFELATDPGLEFGGWNLDELCVVAAAGAICGDGARQGPEQCDDGDVNSDLPDACRNYCRFASCGDLVLDSGEDCDDGNIDPDDGCLATCRFPDEGCGCRGGGSGSGSAIWPLLAVITLGLRRRRRATALSLAIRRRAA